MIYKIKYISLIVSLSSIVFISSCTSSPKLFLVRSYLGIPGSDNIIRTVENAQNISNDFPKKTKSLERQVKW